MVRHILNNDRIGSNADVGTDRNRSKDLCPRSKVNIIAQSRSPRSIGAQCNLVINVNIPASHDVAVNDNSMRMYQNKSRAELGATTDNTPTKNRIAAIEQQFEWVEMPATGPLH